MPTRAEAWTGLEVAAVGLVEEGGAARRDGAEAEPECDGSGRKAVGSGRWAMVVGSSNEKSGSGK